MQLDETSQTNILKNSTYSFIHFNSVKAQSFLIV